MEYKTFFEAACSELCEKKSRFIGYASPAQDEAYAQNFINSIKKKHWDARHNVYAYRIKNGTTRCSDDGEPQGTGGIPLLGVIEKKDLYDVVIVVTRYFGGVLLGAGGLARAYGQAAAMAAELAGAAEICKQGVYGVDIDYGSLERVLSALELVNAGVEGTTYEEKVRLRYAVDPKKEDELLELLTEILRGAPEITSHGTKLIKTMPDGV